MTDGALHTPTPTPCGHLQIVEGLLAGTDDHIVDFEEPRFSIHRDMQSLVVHLLVRDARHHVHPFSYTRYGSTGQCSTRDNTRDTQQKNKQGIIPSKRRNRNRLF